MSIFFCAIECKEFSKEKETQVHCTFECECIKC
jgi:hypothetical protein